MKHLLLVAALAVAILRRTAGPPRPAGEPPMPESVVEQGHPGSG